MMRCLSIRYCYLSCLLLLAGTANATTVYYEKDSNGNPVFSDNSKNKQASEVRVQPANTVNLPDPKPLPADEYRELKIHQRSAQPFQFEARSEPGLKAGHYFAWMIDGALKKKSVSRFFYAGRLNPGQHNIQLLVIDAEGKTIRTADRRVTLKPPQQATDSGQTAKIKEKSPCKGMPTKAGKHALWKQYQYQQYDKKQKNFLEAGRWELDKIVNKDEHEKIRNRPCEFKAEQYIKEK